MEGAAKPSLTRSHVTTMRKPDSDFPLPTEFIDAIRGGRLHPVPPPALPGRIHLLELAEELAWFVVGLVAAYAGSRLLSGSNFVLGFVGLLALLSGVGIASLNGIRFLYGLILMAWGVILSYYRRIFQAWPMVVCPKCGAKSSLKRYINGPGCKECGSTTAYCGECGKPMQVMRIFTEHGCPHCHARVIQVRW